eukprot:m.738 g.738  ORF g.738 m.738 type:complete len:795 (-) comp302_c0_seq1:153-2537(-)
MHAPKGKQNGVKLKLLAEDLQVHVHSWNDPNPKTLDRLKRIETRWPARGNVKVWLEKHKEHSCFTLKAKKKITLGPFDIDFEFADIVLRDQSSHAMMTRDDRYEEQAVVVIYSEGVVITLASSNQEIMGVLVRQEFNPLFEERSAEAKEHCHEFCRACLVRRAPPTSYSDDAAVIAGLADAATEETRSAALVLETACPSLSGQRNDILFAVSQQPPAIWTSCTDAPPSHDSDEIKSLTVGGDDHCTSNVDSSDSSVGDDAAKVAGDDDGDQHERRRSDGSVCERARGHPIGGEPCGKPCAKAAGAASSATVPAAMGWTTHTTTTATETRTTTTTTIVQFHAASAAAVDLNAGDLGTACTSAVDLDAALQSVVGIDVAPQRAVDLDAGQAQGDAKHNDAGSEPGDGQQPATLLNDNTDSNCAVGDNNESDAAASSTSLTVVRVWPRGPCSDGSTGDRRGSDTKLPLVHVIDLSGSTEAWNCVQATTHACAKPTSSSGVSHHPPPDAVADENCSPEHVSAGAHTTVTDNVAQGTLKEPQGNCLLFGTRVLRRVARRPGARTKFVVVKTPAFEATGLLADQQRVVGADDFAASQRLLDFHLLARAPCNPSQTTCCVVLVKYGDKDALKVVNALVTPAVPTMVVHHASKASLQSEQHLLEELVSVVSETFSGFGPAEERRPDQRAWLRHESGGHAGPLQHVVAIGNGAGSGAPQPGLMQLAKFVELSCSNPIGRSGPQVTQKTAVAAMCKLWAKTLRETYGGANASLASEHDHSDTDDLAIAYGPVDQPLQGLQVFGL